MGLSSASMKHLIFPQPRALFHPLYCRTMFHLSLKKIPVNNKQLYYLLIASDTDTDHNVDCIRHYEYNLESQSKIKLSNATGNCFLLLICRAQGLILICDSEWVQWQLLISMIMNFWGPWKARNFYTISATTSFSRRTLLFAIGCEFAHYRVQWQALVNVVKSLLGP
jgi:hypothetical protein